MAILLAKHLFTYNYNYLLLSGSERYQDPLYFYFGFSYEC